MNPSLGSQPGKILVGSVRRNTSPRPASTHRDLPEIRRRLNDNYCLSVPLGSLTPGETSVSLTDLVNVQQAYQTGPVSGETNNSLKFCAVVNSGVVDHVHYVKGQPQKKGVSPVFVQQKQPLKYVNNVFCVDLLCSVRPVPNVAQTLPVGTRLNHFWETWQALGASQKVVQMLREGYTLPFRPDQIWPGLQGLSAAMYIPAGTLTWWRHCIS